MDPVVKVRETMKDFLFDTARDIHFVGTEEELIIIVKRTIAKEPLNVQGSDPFKNFFVDDTSKFRKHGQRPNKVKIHSQIIKKNGRILEELEIQGFSPYNATDIGMQRLSA